MPLDFSETIKLTASGNSKLTLGARHLLDRFNVGVEIVANENNETKGAYYLNERAESLTSEIIAVLLKKTTVKRLSTVLAWDQRNYPKVISAVRSCLLPLTCNQKLFTEYHKGFRKGNLTSAINAAEKAANSAYATRSTLDFM